MVIRGVQADGSDYEMILNRPSDLGPITKTYTFSAAFLMVTTPVFVDFLSEANAYGKVVANGSGTTAVSQGQVLNGTTYSTQSVLTIPNISFNSKIATLQVGASQRLQPGTSKDLSFSALDSTGAIIPVPYGSCLWATDNDSVLNFYRGTAQANSEGRAYVTARVDGINSAATSVMVYPKVSSISLNSAQAFNIGIPTKVLYTTVAAGSSTTIPYDEFEYVSSDTSILKFVNSMAVGVKAGKVNVTARFKNFDGTYTTSPTTTLTVLP
jgi:hypothetical protein